MKTLQRVSPTLGRDSQNDQLCCAKCGQALPQADGKHWKDGVPVSRAPAAALPGWSASVHPQLELRQFSCPACAALLDTEVALPEDPFLYDVVSAVR